jgi:hypothetical protein
MILHDEFDIIKFVEVLKNLDWSKPQDANVDVYDPTSSKAQKNLYWKWIDLIIKTTGNYKYDQDKLLRESVLTPIYYTNTKGKEKTYYKHISDIGKKEMSEYMTQVSIMAAEFGIILPHPEDEGRNQ